MPTRADVIRRAHQRLGVLAHDDALSADGAKAGGEVLDSLFAEVTDGLTVSWTLADVPSKNFVPLANLLAVDLAPEYTVAPPEPRSRAWTRFRATILSDDRKQRFDLDEDGTLSDAELAASDRAAYY